MLWRQRTLAILLVLGGGLMVLALLGGTDDGAGLYLRPRSLIAGFLGLVLIGLGAGLGTAAGHRAMARWIEHEPKLGPSKIVLLGVWFGLLTGMLETAIWSIRTFGFGHLDPTMTFGPHILWMAPLVDTVLFAGLGICLYAANWLWRGLVTLRIAVFLFAFAAVFVAGLATPELSHYAVLLLAAGVATQVAQWAVARALRAEKAQRPLPQLARKEPDEPPAPGDAEAASVADSLPSRRQFLASAAAAMAGLTLAGYGGTTLPHPWTSVLTGAPSLGGKPNVLLIVLDTVRAQNLSLYGYARRTTPFLEELAQRGVRFDWAIATAPWTLPSHASMFTGRWHHELSVDWTRPLDAAFPTVAEMLRDHGYATAGFVANLDFCCAPYGLARGFSHYEDFPVSVGETILSSVVGRKLTNQEAVRQLLGYHDTLNRKRADQICSAFLSWQRRQAERPFFAFLNFYDAHQPYLPLPPYDALFGSPRTGDVELVYSTNDAERTEMWTLGPAEVQRELDAYDGAISYIDAQLRALVDELGSRGVLDHTSVIVTADHGEQFGEHGLFGHANSLYMQALHVPLIVVSPHASPARSVVAEPVSLRELAATIVDLAGLPAGNGIAGKSLARYWQTGPDSPLAAAVLSEVTGGGFAVQDWYPVAHGGVQSLVVEPYHYIRAGNGAEEIYDLRRDPLELHNLVTAGVAPDWLSRFRAHLSQLAG